MELVYLWVEEYKNIEKQGFNFSPRFECKFENDTLTIIEKDKDEYIDNFFGDNINVTAIVGKNGSGKSSIIEQILESLSSIYRDRLSKKYFICFFDGEKLHCDTNNITNIEVHPNPSIEIKKIEEQSQYLLDGLEGIKVLYLDNQTYTANLSFLEQIDTIPTKYGRDEINIIASNENYNKTQTILIKNAQKYKNTLLEKEMKKFFIPTSLEIKYKNISENILSLFKSERSILNILNPFKKNIKSKINTLQQNFNNNLENNKYQDAFIELKKLSDILTNIDNLKNPSILNQLGIDNTISKYTFNSEFNKTYTDKLTYANNTLSIKVEDIDDDLQNFINSLPQGLFDFNLKDDTKSFNELSYGEKQLLILFNHILFYSSDTSYNKVDNQTGEDEDINIKNYFIFLDELEIGMHPDWQKKPIAYLLNLLKYIPNKKFHIILTTHSPFLLSDIPKQNIIFLDTYKKEDEGVENGKQKVGNCKVVDGLSQTFGANIHTLLSDSFFMDGGLMGEFAKDKINNVIKFLTDKESDIKDKDESKKIIEIIGEPFLKQKLEQMYENKYPKSKEEKIQELEAEIERLKND